MKTLRVIEGGERPKAFRKRSPRGAEPLVCSCGSATFLQVKTGVQLRDGKVSGGTKQLACFHCGAICTA